MDFVNVAILKHPLNWAIVVFMLIIAGFIVDAIVIGIDHSKPASHSGIQPVSGS